MPDSAFTDPDEYPEDDAITTRLGDAAGAFTALFDALAEEYPGFSATWKYYRDGKSWLLRSAIRDKTLCWTSVARGFFTASFYLGTKDEAAVKASDLPARTKKAFAETAGNKFRAVSLEMRNAGDIREAMVLAAIKNPVKARAQKPKAQKAKTQEQPKPGKGKKP